MQVNGHFYVEPNIGKLYMKVSEQQLYAFTIFVRCKERGAATWKSDAC